MVRPQNFSPRNLLPLAIGLLVVAAVLYGFLPRSVPIDMAVVARGALLVTIDEDGKTRVKERYEVSSPLAGRLQRIQLHAGDPVVAGETLLASIEPNEPELLDPRALTRAEALIQSRETFKALTVPLLERARASLKFAEKTHARVRKLHERKAATTEELDDAERNLRVASEDVRAFEFASQIATFELEQAKAALIRSRAPAHGKPPDGRFEIRSPVTGRILRVFQESEAAVTAGSRLVEVGNPAILECEIDVLSTDAVKIRPGARAILEHWGGETPLEGRIRRVEPAAFTKVSALGVEEQRVNVLIDFVDSLSKRETLGDGYRVEARIVVWEGIDVLKVPAGALIRADDQWAVYMIENDRARLHPVTIGHNNGIEAEVLAGLKAGDRVIVHPSDKIEDNAPVASREAK